MEDRAGNSSRGGNNFDTGNINLLKRSETDYHRPSQQQQVHFVTNGGGGAHKNTGNHPFHQKSTNMNRLEKIDERKSQSPSTKSKGGVHKGTINNDLSNISINSKNNLEESLRAPGRPPKRIEELTNFLVESHYKKFGVYSKIEVELLKYWREHISAGYRE